MMRPKIVIDVDGTLADTVPAALNMVNQSRGTRFSKDMVTEWNWRLPGTDDNIGSAIRFFFDTRGRIDPVPGAVSAVKELSERFYIVVATARPLYLKDWTVTWLFKNEIVFHDLVMIREKYRLNASILVDDDYRTVAMASQLGQTGILFHQPWNSGVYDPTAVDWDDVLEVVNGTL